MRCRGPRAQWQGRAAHNVLRRRSVRAKLEQRRQAVRSEYVQLMLDFLRGQDEVSGRAKGGGASVCAATERMCGSTQALLARQKQQLLLRSGSPKDLVSARVR